MTSIYDTVGSHTFTAGESGWYEVRVWGAQGGAAGADDPQDTYYAEGGKGGYAELEILLFEGESIDLKVGGEGDHGQDEGSGGWNGGADGGLGDRDDGTFNHDCTGGGGGGASDVRPPSGGLTDRYVVGAGGGGAGGRGVNADITGAGGGGGAGWYGGGGGAGNAASSGSGGGGGTQTTGGDGSTSTEGGSDQHGEDGSFGTGGAGGDSDPSMQSDSVGGDGGAGGGLEGEDGDDGERIAGGGAGAGSSYYDDDDDERRNGNIQSDQREGDGLIEVELVESEPLEAVDDLTVVDTRADEADLEWTDSNDYEEGYLVEQRLATEESWTQVADLDAGSESYTADELLNGREYDWRVIAYRSDDESDPSNVASTTTVLPDLASIDADAKNSTDIDVEWVPVSNHGEIRIEYRDDGDASWTHHADLDHTADETTIENLDTSTLYHVRGRTQTQDTDGNWVEDTAITGFFPPEVSIGTVTETSIELVISDVDDATDRLIVERRD